MADGPPLTASAAAQMGDWHPHQLQFYDKWVMRDVDGSVPSNSWPYVTSTYSVERMHQGWTFPVSCCWNGIASIKAKPFMEGLHFRCDSPAIVFAYRICHMIRLQVGRAGGKLSALWGEGKMAGFTAEPFMEGLRFRCK